MCTSCCLLVLFIPLCGKIPVECSGTENTVEADVCILLNGDLGVISLPTQRDTAAFVGPLNLITCLSLSSVIISPYLLNLNQYIFFPLSKLAQIDMGETILTFHLFIVHSLLILDLLPFCQHSIPQNDAIGGVHFTALHSVFFLLYLYYRPVIK